MGDVWPSTMDFRNLRGRNFWRLDKDHAWSTFGAICIIVVAIFVAALNTTIPTVNDFTKYSFTGITGSACWDDIAIRIVVIYKLIPGILIPVIAHLAFGDQFAQASYCKFLNVIFVAICHFESIVPLKFLNSRSFRPLRAVIRLKATVELHSPVALQAPVCNVRAVHALVIFVQRVAPMAL